MQQFFVKYMSFPLMITVGIGTNLSDYAKVFTNPANLLIIIATVVGAMIGTFIMGKFLHFYPVEAMLTAGLRMANGGGSGDVQCLGAANRMEMMSYAQIVSIAYANPFLCSPLRNHPLSGSVVLHLIVLVSLGISSVNSFGSPPEDDG